MEGIKNSLLWQVCCEEKKLFCDAELKQTAYQDDRTWITRHLALSVNPSSGMESEFT